MHVLEWVGRMFEQYGYLVLLFGLPVDFIALPLPPGQTTLTITGYLAYKGTLKWLPSILFGIAGSIIGVTTTYLIGYKAGAPFIKRYGRWFFLKPQYLDKTRIAYEKHGNKLLMFSFYIPGVRQFFSYFVGIIRIPFRTFALYAYSGVALWVFVFISIGYIFGEQWQYVIALVEKYLNYFFGVLGIVLVVFFYQKWRKWRLKNVSSGTS